MVSGIPKWLYSLLSKVKTCDRFLQLLCFCRLLALVTSALAVRCSCVRLLLVPHNAVNRRTSAQQNGLHVWVAALCLSAL